MIVQYAQNSSLKLSLKKLSFLNVFLMIILLTLFINSFPLHSIKMVVLKNISLGLHRKHLLHRLHPIIIIKIDEHVWFDTFPFEFTIVCFTRKQFSRFLALFLWVTPNCLFVLLIFQPVHSFSVRQRFYIHNKKKHFNLYMNVTFHNDSLLAECMFSLNVTISFKQIQYINF